MLTTVSKPIKTPKILNRYRNKCQPLFPDEVNFVWTTSISTAHISGQFQYNANGGNASNDQTYVGQTDRLLLLWCIGKRKKLYAIYTQKIYRIPVIVTENEYINIAVCETNYFRRARVN